MAAMSRIAGRIATLLVSLAGLLFVTFALGRLLPVDPVLAVVGDRAPPDLYAKVAHDMHLDRPIAIQFALYAAAMARGDFGQSSSTGQPIMSDIARFFPATLELATFAIVIGVGLGIPTAVFCVRHAGRLGDHLGRIVSLLGLSIPVFWLGLVGLLVFYAKLGWVGGPGRTDVAFQYSVPVVTGLAVVDAMLSGDWAAVQDALSHLVLPGGILGLVAFGYVTRMTRGFLLWQMGQDYVTVARLKGLSEAAILWRHALPAATGPVLTVILWTYAYLLEGAVLTETVFAWPGIGLYVTQSLFAGDVPAVLVGTLVIGAVFMLINQCGDLVQAALDPRSRAR
jgi:peptide/nickel transport system permease protein